MVDDDQTADPPEWWKSTLTAAWIETRMEADRTMVALSAGGIALLVTLLTTVGSEGSWSVTMYSLALLSFNAAIIFGLTIFKANAAHIAEAANDPEKADTSRLRPRLRKLDFALMISFGLGILFSILVGVTAAASAKPTPEPARSQTPTEAQSGGQEAVRSGDTAQPDTLRAEELRGANESQADKTVHE